MDEASPLAPASEVDHAAVLLRPAVVTPQVPRAVEAAAPPKGPRQVAANEARVQAIVPSPTAALPGEIIVVVDATAVVAVQPLVDDAINAAAVEVAVVADHGVRKSTKLSAKNPIRHHSPKPCKRARSHCGRSVI